jgi:hypothetical protein
MTQLRSSIFPLSGVRARGLAATLAVAAVSVFSTSAHAAEPQFTPLGASVPAPPQPVTATDGRVHLVYEIGLLSIELGGTVPVEVQSLDVRTPGGRSLASLTGSELVMTTGAPLTPSTTLAPGAGGTVWLDVTLPRGGRVPRALVHRLRVHADYPAPVGSRTFTFDTARTRVGRRKAISISPPLRGGGWLNFNGCCELGPHRGGRVSIDGGLRLPQRFATDYLRIDDQGLGFEGDVDRNESWYGYREPVFAVADGVVVSTRDDLPENTPPVEPPIETFTPDSDRGNSVVLRLGDGRYALFGHLHTGSVRVRPGQRVRAGQMLGRLGNTGASGAPHLHLDVGDSPQALAGNGLPFVFDRFRVTGVATNLEEFLNLEPAVVDPVRIAARRGQYPLQATVLEFGGVRDRTRAAR